MIHRIIRNKKTNMKLFIITILSAFIFTPLAITAPLPKYTSSELGDIARLVSAITVKQHYTQHPLDNTISRQLFDEYFKTLDPAKIFFTEQDIKKFEVLRDKLDNQLYKGDVQFAFDVYKLFLKKLEMYEKFSKEIISKGFDFSKDETFMFDRTKAKWAKNQNALKILWRKKIKYEILNLRLMEKAKKLEEKKERKKTKQTETDKKPKDLFLNKSPAQRVESRIVHFVSYAKQRDNIGILELYLNTLENIYDPHSAYMSPRTEEDFNISMKLSLVGIGALLTMEDGYTKIVKLIPGGPAAKDGRLMPGDRIIAVAQENSPPVDIIDMPLSKVVSMIRGKKDTKVFLTILAAKDGVNAIPKVIALTRDKVILKESEAKGEIKTIKLSNNKRLKIGVISLPSFYVDFDAASKGVLNYKSSSRDVKNIIKKFKKQKIDGLILDIRSNGGGSLQEAIELTGLFIDTGPIVQVKDYTGSIDVKKDEDRHIFYKGPLLVLTNMFSASASEIFAGAIQDYKRGIIMGDIHTHGKGTVQTVFNLNRLMQIFGLTPPAGAIKLTTAKFYRISGSSTQEKGVTPDITLPSFTSVMKIGEKYLPHVLPWDTIDSAPHKIYNRHLSKIVKKLKIRCKERISKDPEFTILKNNIKLYQQIINKKEISLNEKVRWEEYLKEKKLREEQTALMKLKDDDNEDSRSNKKKKKFDDLYLREALKVMRDYINLINLQSKS